MSSDSNVCEICLKTFCKKSELVRHMYVHQERPKLECNECSKKFTTTLSLERHLNAHNRAKKSKHSCKICFMSFGYKSSLSDHHVKHHIALKVFTCKICKAEFSWEENFKKHQRTHDDSTHQCRVCCKTFLDATSLRIHSKKHKKEDPETNQLSCDICGMVFQYDFSLKAHVKSHDASSSKCKTIKPLAATQNEVIKENQTRRVMKVLPKPREPVKRREKKDQLFGELSMAAEPHYSCQRCESDTCSLIFLNANFCGS